MDEFQVIRHYIKRKITHKFIDMDIYSSFSNFFEYKHIENTTLESFSTTMNFLSDILSKEKYFYNYKNDNISGTCLLEYLLKKDILNIKLELDTAKYFPPKYITKDEFKKYSTEQLKNKIKGMIAGEYIEADAYRLAIYFIEKNKRKELYLEEIKSLKNLVNKFQEYDYYINFLNILISLLEYVINTDYSKFYFYNNIKDKQFRTDILDNTFSNITKIDENISIDQTLLSDIGITQDNFNLTFDSDDLQNIIYEKFFDNIGDLQDFDGFNSDILISNFEFNDNEDNIVTVSDVEKSNKGNLSLLDFSTALIESINQLLLIRTIGKQHSSKKQRILNKIDKYSDTAKFSYLQHLRKIRYFAENRPKANYIFIVYLSHYLDLSKAQTQVLSKKFRMLNKDTHYKVFDSMREEIFFNYRFLRKN